MSLTSCKWGDEIVSLVQPNPDDFLVLYSDTSSVVLSTVIYDSLMTGAAGRMLIGRLKDPYLGTMYGAAFFQPAMSDQNPLSLPLTAVYDSLVLKLPYEKYYYGDTTKTMTFSVHALTADILSKGLYFNHNSTGYFPSPLAKIKFTPFPHTNQNLRFKLPDTLGRKIFDRSMANLLPNNDEFLTILLGLTVLPDPADNGSIIGLKAFGDSSVVELHYHTPDIDAVTKSVGRFPIHASYNQTVGDRSNTALAKLPSTRRLALPSAQSGEKTFIQAGTGIMTRVDFPNIRTLKDVKYTVANRAFMQLEPFKESVSKAFAAPDTIYAYLCDRNNQFYAASGGVVPLTNLANSGVFGVHIYDLVNNREYYSFDMSAHITTLMNSNSDLDNGLLLVTTRLGTNTTYPELGTGFSDKVTRIVIGSQKNPVHNSVKLQLYYTTVKAQ